MVQGSGHRNGAAAAAVADDVTQEQRYRVRESHGPIEVRDYEPCVVADITVAGTAEQAGNTAFRPLLSYISGRNSASASLDMTAPVIQQQAGERLAMTAPVIQEQATDTSWVVSFVLPGSRPLAEYPVPDDDRVMLRAVPAQSAVALRWSGRWTARNVDARTAELTAWLARAGRVPVGEPRWARFDPPWKPPFARRNEIVIPIAGADSAD
jgi:hypothetical protein